MEVCCVCMLEIMVRVWIGCVDDVTKVHCQQTRGSVAGSTTATLCKWVYIYYSKKLQYTIRISWECASHICIRLFEYWMHCMYSSLFLFQCFELPPHFNITHAIWIASAMKIFDYTIYSVAQWPPMRITYVCMYYVALLLVVSALKRGYA